MYFSISSVEVSAPASATTGFIVGDESCLSSGTTAAVTDRVTDQKLCTCR